MSPSNVIILSPNTIFREGLKRLLAQDRSLALVGETASLDDVQEMSRDTQADVIIVQQQGSQAAQIDTISKLLAIPSARLQVVAVSLDETGMQIYHRENVAEATVAGLIAALKDLSKEEE